MPDLDPFTQTYNALWTMFARSPILDYEFPAKNRIMFSDENPAKDNVLIADTPEIALIGGGASFGERDSTTDRGLVRTWTWIFASGDIRINPLYNKVCFELFRVMVDWESTLCPLTWNDCQFVHNCQLKTADEGTSMEYINRGVVGWSGLWSLDITYRLPTAKLRFLTEEI